MSVFKDIPNKKNNKILIKKMASSFGLKNAKPNQIFKSSSLKYLNLDGEFHMIKMKIKKYYKDEIIKEKFKSNDIETIDNIINIYNDFFNLENLQIARYYAQKDVKSKLEYINKNKLITTNNNNSDSGDNSDSCNNINSNNINNINNNDIDNSSDDIESFDLLDSNDIYYKIYSKIEYENILKDEQKFNKNGSYIMEF